MVNGNPMTVDVHQFVVEKSWDALQEVVVLRSRRLESVIYGVLRVMAQVRRFEKGETAPVTASVKQ